MSDDKPNTFMEDYKRDTVKAMSTRIEALEAALREILPLAEAAAALDPEPWTGTGQAQIRRLRAALAPEQDK